jgi:hypothetical protein
MKFRKIELKDHPVFGDVKFDFTDAKGQSHRMNIKAKTRNL